MYVVVLFEPARQGENLSLAQQVNEVFGPFGSIDAADAWCADAQEALPSDREWHLVPLAPPREMDEMLRARRWRNN